MYKSHMIVAWDHTALLCCVVARLLGAEDVKLADYNPYREEVCADTPTISAVNIATALGV